MPCFSNETKWPLQNYFVAIGLSYGKSNQLVTFFGEGKTADVDERHDFSSCILLYRLYAVIISNRIIIDRIPLLLRNIYFIYAAVVRERHEIIKTQSQRLIFNSNKFFILLSIFFF